LRSLLETPTRTHAGGQQLDRQRQPGTSACILDVLMLAHLSMQICVRPL
jgi:hypothetical protein